MACSVCTPSNCAPNYRSASSSETTLICSPARTGKTRALSLRFLTGWVHPHMCEENTYQIPVWICGPGSSPRVRGKQGRRRPGQRHEGLIPACAGKTVNIPHCICEEPAHPRACGENREIEFFGWYEQGSSPRMRGKPVDDFQLDRAGGLIPAHAGKTNVLVLQLSNRGAHPRACGENDHEIEDAIREMGSSPRMRGKRFDAHSSAGIGGLIPAHAGKTVLFEVRAAAARAHPRACGENTIPRSFHRSLSGSSPRMRGKPGFRILVGQPVGLIPAHAGKTLKCRNEQRPKGAHPRACGENGGGLGGC